ncbi:MAG: hypothetical protein ABIT36_01150 [Steroidobacteraceae bacterium]
MNQKKRPRGGIEGNKNASPRTLPPDARVSYHGAAGEGGAESQALARPKRQNGMAGRKARA